MCTITEETSSVNMECPKCGEKMRTTMINKSLYEHFECEKCGTRLETYKTKYIDGFKTVLTLPIGSDGIQKGNYKIIRKDWDEGEHVEIYIKDSLTSVRNENWLCRNLYHQSKIHLNACALCEYNIDKCDFHNANCNNCKLLKEIKRLQGKEGFFKILSQKKRCKKLIKERTDKLLSKNLKSDNKSVISNSKKKSLAEKFIQYFSVEEEGEKNNENIR